MKKMRIIFALTLTFILLFALSACGEYKVTLQVDQLEAFLAQYASSGNVAENTTAAPVIDTPSTLAPSEVTTAAPVAEPTTASAPAAPSTPDASGQTETTTAAPAVENTTAAPANTAPSTPAEIVAYFVSAYNKIGSDASSIVRTYDYTSNYNSILNINGNGTLKALAEKLMGTFMKEDFSEVAGDINALHPMGLSTISMTEAQVGSATIADNGSTYTITLTSTGTEASPEADLLPGQGSAGMIGPLLRTDDVANAAKGFLSFDGLHAYYPTATTVVTVDKASGHITGMEFSSPCILHFDKVTVVFLNVANCDIGLLFQQKWTINY